MQRLYEMNSTLLLGAYFNPRSHFSVFLPVLKNGCYTQTFVRVNGRWWWCVCNLDGLFTTCGLGFEVSIFIRKTYALNCLLVQILSWGFFSLVKFYPTNIHGNPFLMLLNSGKHSQLTILQSIYMVTRSLYMSTKNRVESCLNSYNNGRIIILLI
jgi:hypothetical protein